jgi:8-oxo-dGTP diphosphatase
MDDWSNVPVFGDVSGRELCVIRPGAYALVADEGYRLAVVRTDVGIFLPGGGIEAHESPEARVTREAREECGLVLRAGAWRASAIQFVYSEPEQANFQKRSTFIECAIDGPSVAVLETDHELLWQHPSLAIDRLSHESQRWAAACWSQAIKSLSNA